MITATWFARLYCIAILAAFVWFAFHYLIEGAVRLAARWEDWRMDRFLARRRAAVDEAAVAALYARYTEEAQR